VVGIGLESVWLFIGAVSTWLSEAPTFTSAMAQERHVPWKLLLDALQPWFGLDSPQVPSDDPRRPVQVAFAIALVLASALYLVGLVVVGRVRGGRKPLAAVAGFALLFQVTLLGMPGLFSTDVITYATNGRLGGVLGFDPYLAPSAWPGLGPTEATWWWFVPTPYGPVWTDVSAALSRLTADLNPTSQVLAYKALATLAWATCLALLWWLLRHPFAGPHRDADRAVMFTLFAWNPLVLFETGNGHNDVVMAALFLAALVPLAIQGDRPITHLRVWLPVIVLLSLATLVKFLPAICALFLTVTGLRQLCGWRQRAIASSFVFGVVGVLVAVTASPWFDSPAVLGTMLSAAGGGQRYAHSIVDIPTWTLVARYLDKLSEHIPQSVALAHFWEQLVVRSLFAVYLFLELRRVWTDAAGGGSQAVAAALSASLRVTLVVLVFVVTQTLDYYFILPLAIAAILGWRYTSARVAVAMSVLYLPTFYLRRMELEPLPNVFLVAALAGPLLLPLIAQATVFGGSRLRRRLGGRLLVSSCLVLPILSACITSRAPAVSAQRVKLTLNAPAGGTHAGFVYAKALGQYADVGLDVTIDEGRGSHITTQRVASGATTFGVVDATTAMQLRAQGAPVTIVAVVMQSTPFAIFSLESSHITEPRDLIDRTLGIPPNTTEAALLPAALASSEIASGRVKVVPVEPTVLLDALLERRVDAIVGSADFHGVQLRTNGVRIHELAYRDLGVRLASLAVVANDSLIRDDPALVNAFVAASLRGWDATRQNPYAAAKAVADRFLPSDPSFVFAQLEQDVRFLCAPDAEVLGMPSDASWQASEVLLTSRGLLSVDRSVHDYYTRHFIPADAPRCPST
jgi:NitT/TauT family transport system substrate-binding protein